MATVERLRTHIETAHFQPSTPMRTRDFLFGGGEQPCSYALVPMAMIDVQRLKHIAFRLKHTEEFLAA